VCDRAKTADVCLTPHPAAPEETEPGAAAAAHASASPISVSQDTFSETFGDIASNSAFYATPRTDPPLASPLAMASTMALITSELRSQLVAGVASQVSSGPNLMLQLTVRLVAIIHASDALMGNGCR